MDPSKAVDFNHQVFQSHLSTQSLGRPLHHFDCLDSTNTKLWTLIEQGALPGTAVMATQQQAGRGQWGRTWCSPPGGLYLSVAIAPQINVDQVAQLTVCSAWGMAKILRAYKIPVWLKWPNDLLLDGSKLGGILTETSLRQGQVHRAVIGIGINWQNPVLEQAINLSAVLIRQPQPTIQSLEMLAAITLQGLENGYRCWQTDGLETLWPDYLSLVKVCDSPQAMAALSGN